MTPTNPFNFLHIKVIEHKYLELGTIWVSSDIAALLKAQYTEEGKDAAFLKLLGISTETDSKETSI